MGRERDMTQNKNGKPSEEKDRDTAQMMLHTNKIAKPSNKLVTLYSLRPQKLEPFGIAYHFRFLYLSIYKVICDFENFV